MRTLKRCSLIYDGYLVPLKIDANKMQFTDKGHEGILSIKEIPSYVWYQT